MKCPAGRYGAPLATPSTITSGSPSSGAQPKPYNPVQEEDESHTTGWDYVATNQLYSDAENSNGFNDFTEDEERAAAHLLALENSNNTNDKNASSLAMVVRLDPGLKSAACSGRCAPG